MADTLPNISIPAGVWTDIYSLSGLNVGTALVVENVGDCDVYLAVQAQQPDRDHNSYNVLKRKGDPLRNSVGDSGAWAYCNNESGKINVREAL